MTNGANTFTVSFTLTARVIADMIESAGFGYWGRYHTHKPGTVPYTNTEKDKRQDIDPQTWAILTDGHAVILEHAGHGELHVLDRVAVERGLTVLSEKHPHVMAEILAGNSDADTGDLLVQAALFGELVYG